MFSDVSFVALSSFFPLGISQYILGGIFIGLAVVLGFLFTGKLLGHSSVFSSTWSYISSLRYFHQAHYRKARQWRLLFALGTVLGALIFTVFTGDWFVSSFSWWQLLVGGFLVGFGARYSRGCTSGHGICGMSSLSGMSTTAVIIFMIVAVSTAQLIQFLGAL